MTWCRPLLPTTKINKGNRYRKYKKLCRVELVPDKATPDDSVDNKSGADEGKKRSILCAGCRTVITSSRYGIQIEHNHEHTFFNPAGIIFEILCFSQARNIFIHGEPSTEFSWFKGYAWEIITCRRCVAHLGWRFSREGTYFFGLIKQKLISSSTSSY